MVAEHTSGNLHRENSFLFLTTLSSLISLDTAQVSLEIQVEVYSFIMQAFKEVSPFRNRGPPLSPCIKKKDVSIGEQSTLSWI